MASHTTLTKAQAEILGKVLKDTLPKDINKSIEKYGMEDAFRIHQLAERFAPAPKEEE